MGNIFTVLFINPVINLLVVVYQGLVMLHVPYAFGFAIILLSALFRILLFPLIASQLHTSKKMQELTPHLNKLKELHKNDATKLQSETMRLYKEHGVNPVAGCLPLLIQMPLIIGFYSVLNQAVKTNPKEVVAYVNNALYPFLSHLKLQHMWDQNFFGLPLGQTPSHLLPIVGVGILLFPIITAALQLLQSKMMMPIDVNKQTSESKLSSKKDAKKDDEDFATAFQSQSLYLVPLMIGFFSFTLPLGLSLYWNTFTIFGILQQYQIGGWGGAAQWLDKIRKK